MEEEIWRRLDRGRIRFRCHSRSRSHERSRFRFHWGRLELGVGSRERERREEVRGGGVVDGGVGDEEEGIEGKGCSGKDDRIAREIEGYWESEIEEGKNDGRFRGTVGNVEEGEEGSRLRARSFDRKAWVGGCRRRTERAEGSWGTVRGDGEVEEEEEGTVATRTTPSKASQDRTLRLRFSFLEMVEDQILAREVEILLLLDFQTQRYHRSTISSLLAYPPRLRLPRRSYRRHSVVHRRLWGWRSWKRA